MDKLQWFKFCPSDWMMGKIQRCPEITQARFIRLCSLYWNKKCELSKFDAEIEIDKEHLDILLGKKIISESDLNINISFLDEQLYEIEEENSSRSLNGSVGNLKRWHPIIYKRYSNKEISLEKAIELSKNDSDAIGNQSPPDSGTIETQSQNIAEKKREEDIKKEKKKSFYESEISNNNLDENSLYFKFYKFLLEHEFSEKFLSLKNQITLDNFNSLLETSKENEKKVIKSLDELLNYGENKPTFYKGKTNAYLTLNNWIKK